MCTKAAQTLSDEPFKSSGRRNEVYSVAWSQTGLQEPTRVCHTYRDMRSWQLLWGIYLNTALCLQLPSRGRPGVFLAPGVVQSQAVYFPTLAKGTKYQADFQNGSCSDFKIKGPICKETQKNTGCHWFLDFVFF